MLLGKNFSRPQGAYHCFASLLANKPRHCDKRIRSQWNTKLLWFALSNPPSLSHRTHILLLTEIWCTNGTPCVAVHLSINCITANSSHVWNKLRLETGLWENRSGWVIVFSENHAARIQETLFTVLNWLTYFVVDPDDEWPLLAWIKTPHKTFTDPLTTVKIGYR